MRALRIATAFLAVGIVSDPAIAEEYAVARNLASAAIPECHNSILLNQPPSWRTSDDAVVLIALGPSHNPMRNALVSALLHQQVAVLELSPVACNGMSGGRNRALTAAVGALDTLAREMNAERVVAIAIGPGGRAVLDVLQEPVASGFGATRRRYAAAVAIGDGAPAFLLGSPPPVREAALGRLAALCHALAAVVGGLGATPDRAGPAAASEACDAAMSAEATRR